jgi:hypothetical protein
VWNWSNVRAKLPPKKCSDEVGGGIGQGRQDSRLAEASASAGISGPPTPLGGGTLLCLDLSQQEDEQRLREVVCNQRGVGVRCHESPHAEAIGSHLRLFHTVSEGEFSANFAKRLRQ